MAESRTQAAEYHRGVARNIRIIMEDRGKSAKDVYERLGMSKSTWCTYMREPGRMDLEFISGVARCLNVSTVSLLTKEFKLVEIGGGQT